MVHVISVKYNPFVVARLPLQLIYLLEPGNTLFAAVIKENGEQSLALERQAPSFSWHEPLKLGNLEVIITKSSQLNVHEPVPSDSDDSDAHYFGRNDELGMLLQYLGPDAWRTEDAVAHTSVHHHEKGRETYYLLGGTASVELRDFRTGRRMGNASPFELGVGQEAGYIKGSTVRPYVQHPVVATNHTHSVMLLVTDPPNNTKSDHHYDGLFRDIFADVIASYTQRTRDPFATAKEAGSQRL